MTPTELVATTAPQMVRIGAAFYFYPSTVAVAKEHGLNGMNFYVAGRGGALGNANAVTVRSAFGYFHPGVIAKLWNSAVEVMEPTAIADLFIDCAHQVGRELFAGIDDDMLAGFVDTARRVIEVPEGVAMALFSGLRARPVPDDLPAAAMHQAMVLREMRGDAHLISVVASGLPTEVAHAINRPNDVANFGWTEPIEPTEEQRWRWTEAESLTDRLMESAYSVVEPADADIFAAASQAMFDALPAS